MGIQQKTVDFILEQMTLAGQASAKEMFGEYGLYLHGKMFALVCDDQLFIKPRAGTAPIDLDRGMKGEALEHADLALLVSC